ncbi:NYN domain-containing protein [Nostoc parmelioides]|uniref:NYN domain-containing protein n=1 Tax=Nostoc parmelioides FACHB-3921 TaxID=2692909 RepID=A0ABR8BKM5_9NOSO|nr:NYN domain-containing protein [Nostoc parmelioides]MBD2254416.1 NYN domain-containing protein [Nostoc parmelioides FACHB-3921]
MVNSAKRPTGKAKKEQKEIDIMIAVDMLTHSFQKNMDEATLLAGDLDFKPLIDALVLNGTEFLKLVKR